MSIRSLPEDASFENLRKRAKELLAAARSHRPDALELFREFHPRAAGAPARPALADAQLVLARSYGVASWARLKGRLRDVARFRWEPPERLAPSASSSLPLAEGFVRLACVSYGSWDPSGVPEARRMLDHHPELARENPSVAAAAGDVAAARAALARDPRLARQRVGALRWEPLLYAAYSRLAPGEGRSTLEVARLLLAHGADPNAGFLWCGNVPPFTALTGAFGEGEDGNNQPPHPERDALARLLLAAGADPNDGQTLYNRHFRADDGHLRLLFEFGLGRDARGPWFARLGTRMQSPARMLVEELWAAARKGFVERVRLLVEHGVELDTPSVRDGRTPYEAALSCGNREAAEYLARHGARRIELAPLEGFAAACVAGDEPGARALLARHPDLVAELGWLRRAELVSAAVEARKPAGLRLMAALGFELSSLRRNTPLHDAAWSGDLELVRLLIELGADPSVRDPAYQGTPLGWAAHNRQTAVVEYLLGFAGIVEAVQCDAPARVEALLREDPSHARATDARGDPLVFALHAGLAHAPELVALLTEHGADLGARDGEGRTAVDVALARGDAELAALLRRHGVEPSGGPPPA